MPDEYATMADEFIRKLCRRMTVTRFNYRAVSTIVVDTLLLETGTIVSSDGHAG